MKLRNTIHEMRKERNHVNQKVHVSDESRNSIAEKSELSPNDILIVLMKLPT